MEKKLDLIYTSIQLPIYLHEKTEKAPGRFSLLAIHSRKTKRAVKHKWNPNKAMEVR
jgi:glutamate formiminotransferase